MKKSIILTQDIVALLDNEGWLSRKQKEDILNYIGCEFSRAQIEALCSDNFIIETIFEDDVDPYNITYHVHYLEKGLYLAGKPEVFTDVVEAIKYQYKMSKKSPNFLWTIEVNYEGAE